MSHDASLYLAMLGPVLALRRGSVGLARLHPRRRHGGQGTRSERAVALSPVQNVD